MSEGEFGEKVTQHEVTLYLEAVAHAERLNKLTQTLAGEHEVHLRERLFSLSNGAAGETRQQIFDSLCEVVREAFPDPEPTDLQVLTNAATPDLVRYLVASLRRFSMEHSTTEPGFERPLARAFSAKNSAGRKGKFKELEVPMLAAATKAKCAAISAGLAVPAVIQAAKDAAYAVFREDDIDSHGQPIPQEPKDMKKTEAEIEALLLREGAIPG